MVHSIQYKLKMFALILLFNFILFIISIKMVSYSYSHSSLYKRKKLLSILVSILVNVLVSIFKYPKVTNKNKKFVITNNKYLLFGMITYK